MSKKGKKESPANGAGHTGLVLDSSIALAWCFADERDAYSQSVLDAIASTPAYVPDLWHLEVANTLVVGERRGRATQAETATWMNFLAALPITVDDETRSRAFTDIAVLARSYSLSVYDAAYLELAIRRRLLLATLDEKLKPAARSVGLAMFPPS